MPKYFSRARTSLTTEDGGPSLRIYPSDKILISDEVVVASNNLKLQSSVEVKFNTDYFSDIDIQHFRIGKKNNAQQWSIIESYVSGTYRGHYTGTTHEYRNVQTIDLMASRDLAADFCQANILKYGSRYGSKDGKNKKDLMKVIHYAMLLLHFDEHYGKPPITSGNIDHNMP